MLSNFFSLFNQTTVNVLAREAKFDPANAQNPIIIEGDKKGFIPWLLKLIGLSDPSYRLEVIDDKIITCEGKKSYDYLPCSLISGYSVGFKNNKGYLVACLTLLFSSFMSFIAGLGDGEFLSGLGLAVILGALAGLFYWLYKRSGAFTFSIKCYNGEGLRTIRMVSGFTGLKLDKSMITQAAEATALAAKKSNYFS